VSLVSLTSGLVSFVLGLVSLVLGYIGCQSVEILVTVKKRVVKEQVIPTDVVI
jgi:hypothetical protein